VKPSTIPKAGRGLFAAIDFADKDFLTLYNADLIDTAKLTAVEFAALAASEYVMEIPEKDQPLRHARFMVDASRPRSCLGRWLNDSRDGEQNACIKFQALPDGYVVPCIMALRAITKGEELFFDYGPAYWTRQQPSSQGTKKRKRKGNKKDAAQEENGTIEAVVPQRRTRARLIATI
jgi:hypothetical protein